MPVYRYLVADLLTGTIKEEMPFSSVKFSHVLNRPGAFSASIGLRHSKATRDVLDPGRTAIHIERDGVIVWSGILWTAKASIENASLELGGEGWWSYFRHRKIRTTKTYTAQDQLFIVRDLINYAQSITGGNIGVVVGSETSGVTRDRVYYHYERKNLGEAVEQLAEVQGGFDFAIDCAWSGGSVVKTLILSYPRRGRITDLTFQLGTNIQGLSQEVDATRQANLIDSIGSGEADAMLIATAADTSQLTAYPLLEDVTSYKDISVSATLQAHAASDLAKQKRPVTRIPTLLAVQSNPDAGLGTYITGDSVQVVGSDGWLTVSERMRIQVIDVAVDTNGKETVSLQFAQEEASII